MDDANLEIRLRQVRALALDVDGVLTDGGLWWDAGGDEFKRFCFADIMGISLARRAGFKVGLISGEDSLLVDRYAEKMRIGFVAKGCRDKASALRDFVTSTALDLSQICYMGDDVNDLPAMNIAGVSAAPADAEGIVLSHANFVTKRSGGNGAVRDLVDALFIAQGFDIEQVFAKP
jgi:3-deoxy-D-manno-octulosonate 8-phosphate phosphatase (KDO 8-P phosphatase)